jgi:sugar phosphate isomerase/epimerase
MVQENFTFEWKHVNAMDFGSYGIGASVSPAGSQLINTNAAMNWGVNQLELSMGLEFNHQQMGHVASFGKIEREEIARLSRLNSVNLSVHAPPNVEPAGFRQGAFSEDARRDAIRELKQSIDAADQIAAKAGVQHMPVVIHSTQYPLGSPAPHERIVAVQRDSGQVIPLEKKEYSYPGGYLKKLGLISKEEVLGVGNFRQQREQTLDREELAEYRKRIAEMKHNGLWDYEHTFKDKQVIENREFINPMGMLKIENTETMRNLDRQAANVRYSMDFAESRLIQARQAQDPVRMRDAAADIATYRKEMDHIKAVKKHYEDTFGGQPVQLAENYAKEKIAKSIAELAEYSYKKDTQPMIAVENWVPESVGGDPQKVAQILAAARNEFKQRLMEKQRYSPDKAHQISEKMIGATLDIGHTNLWKKYTKWDEAEQKFVEYTNEDIKKWVKDIYPYLKHVHVADNFGDIDAHIPVGWGTVPVKELMGELRQRGFSGRVIFETFGAPQLSTYGLSGGAFGIAESLYQTGMPLVPGGPSWEEAAGSYFRSGYGFTGIPQPGGTYWPDVGQYAVGFTGLPYSTGSRIGGGREGQQFTGAPMS